MITLRDKDSGKLLGTIPDDQLQFLIDELEEEPKTHNDYWLQSETVDMLEEDGAPAELVKLLRDSLGSSDGMEIEWSQSASE